MEQRRALTPADEPRLAPPILAGLGLGLLGGALASKPVTRFIATRMTTGTRDVFRGGKWVAVPDTDQIAHLVPGIEKAVTMFGGSAGGLGGSLYAERRMRDYKKRVTAMQEANMLDYDNMLAKQAGLATADPDEGVVDVSSAHTNRRVGLGAAAAAAAAGLGTAVLARRAIGRALPLLRNAQSAFIEQTKHLSLDQVGGKPGEYLQYLRTTIPDEVPKKLIAIPAAIAAVPAAAVGAALASEYDRVQSRTGGWSETERKVYGRGPQRVGAGAVGGSAAGATIAALLAARSKNKIISPAAAAEIGAILGAVPGGALGGLYDFGMRGGYEASNAAHEVGDEPPRTLGAGHAAAAAAGLFPAAGGRVIGMLPIPGSSLVGAGLRAVGGKAAPIVGTAIGAHALGRNRGLAAAEAERAQEKQSAAVMDFPMASTGTALDDPQVAVLSPERVDPSVQRKRRLAELLRGSQPSQSSTGQLSPAPRM